MVGNKEIKMTYLILVVLLCVVAVGRYDHFQAIYEIETGIPLFINKDLFLFRFFLLALCTEVHPSTSTLRSPQNTNSPSPQKRKRKKTTLSESETSIRFERKKENFDFNKKTKNNPKVTPTSKTVKGIIF